MTSSNYLAAFQVPYDPTDRHGIGVHLLTGLRTAEIALDPAFAIKEDERSPSNFNSEHTVCESQHEFTQTQELNIEGEGSKDSLKIGGGLDIMISRAVTDKSVICVSIASIVTGTDKYDRATARLTDEAKQTLSENPADFARRFGTHFVGGYVRGANFNSVITFETKTATDKMHVGAKLRGSYDDKVKGKGKSGSGSAKYGLDDKTVATLTRVHGKLYATGVSMNANISDLDAVEAAFAKFSQSAMAQSTPVMAICYPYSMLADVTAILRARGEAGSLLPAVPHALIDAICLEARSALRAMAMIASLDRIADKVPALRKISDSYRHKLQAEMDGFRSLSLDRLMPPSADLLHEVGLVDDSQAGVREPESLAAETYRRWRADFKRAYEDVV